MANGNLTFECEYTDTFGGEANYSWVRRAKFTAHEGVSDRWIMREIRKQLGLRGLRGRWDHDGERFEFRPYGHCTVAFANLRY